MEVIFDGVRALIRREFNGLEQAGAIMVRGSGPDRRILLITNKKGDRWIFPKGTIKKSETAEEAAQREAEEEAGIHGRLLAYVGATISEDEEEDVRVNYFLLRAVAQPGEGEDERKQEAFDQLVSTLDALIAERGEDERIWGSMIKQALKRRQPGFNESYHGFAGFNELLEEAQARGLVKLEHDEKSGGYIVRVPK